MNWKKDNRSNTIAIQVSNAHDPFIPPLNVGYASYGGIYRDAWVVTTDKIHFADINTNSSGVYVTTPTVSAKEAMVATRTTVSNETSKNEQVQMISTVYDAKGQKISSFTQSAVVGPGQNTTINGVSSSIANPLLWSPATPNLYTIVTQLCREGQLLDQVENKIGSV